MPTITVNFESSTPSVNPTRVNARRSESVVVTIIAPLRFRTVSALLPAAGFSIVSWSISTGSTANTHTVNITMNSEAPLGGNQFSIKAKTENAAEQKVGSGTIDVSGN